jgi:nucleoid DNA-binding protein
MLKNKRNNLTKNDIKEIINKNLGLPKSFSDNFLVNVFETITKNLKNNNLIKIKNFGSFKVLNKNERIGRNPKNKKKYQISARKIISFKSSKSLLKKING